MIEIDLKIKHHWNDGIFIKQMELPKDHYAVTHEHPYSHFSILAKGEVLVDIDGIETKHTAPSCINISKGQKHKITAISDSFWYCIHATDVANESLFTNVLIEG